MHAYKLHFHDEVAHNAFFKITYYMYVLTFKATKLEQKLFTKQLSKMT